MNLKKQKRK